MEGNKASLIFTILFEFLDSSLGLDLLLQAFLVLLERILSGLLLGVLEGLEILSLLCPNISLKLVPGLLLIFLLLLLLNLIEKT